ncbi:MAG: hypothetical protein AAF449_09020 [Myxococcota bacterium]
MAAAQGAQAEPTRELYISDPKEVLSGDPVSTSIDAWGHIEPGPQIEAAGTAVGHPITSLAVDGRTTLLGTAGGGLFRLGKGKPKPLMAAKDQVITALLPQGKDVLAAVAPKATVFRVAQSTGRSKPFVKLKAQYVWSIAASKTRTLLATGEPGQVVAVDGKGRTEIWFDSTESHLRAMIRHPQRGWIVGGGQKGIVYQLTGNKRARALYDSEFDEVTAFAIDGQNGDLFASFVSAKTAGKPIPERWIGPTKGDKKASTGAGPAKRPPFKGSEVVRIRRSGQVEVLWSSSTEGAMDLAFKGNRLYFSTGTEKDGRARIYAIDVKDRDRLSLWARLDPPLAPKMVETANGLVVGTAPNGEAFRIGPRRQSRATYLSVEQDLARTAQVGRRGLDGADHDGLSPK